MYLLIIIWCHLGIVPWHVSKLCRETGIELHEAEGRLLLERKDERGFLKVLDRRCYRLKLMDNNTEYYLAPSRRPLSP